MLFQSNCSCVEFHSVRDAQHTGDKAWLLLAESGAEEKALEKSEEIFLIKAH